jgi:hypothetical protein
MLIDKYAILFILGANRDMRKDDGIAKSDDVSPYKPGAVL